MMEVAESIRCLANRPKLGQTRERAGLLRSSLARLESVHVAGWRRHLALRLQESRLEIDDVVAELVVLGLHRLEVFAQDLVVAHLFLELLDIALLSLSKCSLVAHVSA
jgi:hypothetical protein